MAPPSSTSVTSCIVITTWVFPSRTMPAIGSGPGYEGQTTSLIPHAAYESLRKYVHYKQLSCKLSVWQHASERNGLWYRR